MTAITVDTAPAPRPAAKFRPIHVAMIVRPLVLDFVSTLFFVGLYTLTHNLLASTAAGVAIGLGQIGWRYARRQKVAAMQWAGLGLVATTALIANLTHSPLVIMLKPSLIYVVFGVATLQPGWMARYALPLDPSPIPRTAFVKVGYFVAALMFVSAALNLGVALTAGLKTWAVFIAIYPFASKLGIFTLAGIGFGRIARRNVRLGRSFPKVTA
jgi:intracellular septation protein A